MYYVLGKDNYFPPVTDADEEGLVAIGGDLSAPRLIAAYKKGIFPWYAQDSPIAWWSPNPRFVLFPQDLQVSKSMKKVISAGKFQYRYNTSFTQVITACSMVPREGQDGTWILPEMIDAYQTLHQLGIAVSAEAWTDGQLSGGLYGIRMGKIFFGESMFAKKSNASKFAFINLVLQLMMDGVVIIDCQTYTSHLASLGAKMIPRKLFCEILDREVSG